MTRTGCSLTEWRASRRDALGAVLLSARYADLLLGLLGLSRYEGWPYLLLYALWRRDPRALRASWGIAS